MNDSINRAEYYGRMVCRAFEVVRKKHGLPEGWPEQGFMQWAEDNDPALHARFSECDKAIETSWDSLALDEFKQRVVSFGKIVIEILEKRHAWEKAQPKEAAPVPAPVPPPAPANRQVYAFSPPPLPVDRQGRLL